MCIRDRLFFVLPFVLPRVTDLANNPKYLTRNQLIETTTTRAAAPVDVARRKAAITAWENADPQTRAANAPMPLSLGDPLTERRASGGKSIFWSEGVKPVDAAGEPIDLKPIAVGHPMQIDDTTVQQTLLYPTRTKMKGFGNFRLEFLLYKPFLDLKKLSTPMLNTLELPLKIALPFACLLYTSPSPRDATLSRMPSSA